VESPVVREGEGIIKIRACNAKVEASLVLVMPSSLGFMECENGCKNQTDVLCFTGKCVMKLEHTLVRPRKYYVL
jgi:hypothetical protein